MQNANHGFYQMKPTQTPHPIIWAFRGEYAFLSNFAPCTVTLPGEANLPAMVFDSTEKAYMAWKTLNQATRETILTGTPAEAKALAHSKGFPLRPDYDDASRLQTMLTLTRQKYGEKNPGLRQKLLQTGNAVLIEGNDWGDTFFGFSLPDGWGHNHLGRILMQVRDEIR